MPKNHSASPAVARLKDQLERAGALLLGAQALLREQNDSATADDREIVAILLDMAIEETGDLSAFRDLESAS